MTLFKNIVEYPSTMNQRFSKKLREIINPQDEVSNRAYRRAKKAFKKIKSPQAQQDFINELQNLYNLK